MVFSGLYPADGSDFEVLNHGIERLTCNDASVSVSKETSLALGLGFRYMGKSNHINPCQHVTCDRYESLLIWIFHSLIGVVS